MSEQVGFKKIEGYVELAGLPCIDPAKVKTIPGYNVRDTFSPDTDEADAQLLASMTANGFIYDKPITIRVVDGVAYVIAGHRRVDAANRANVEAVAKADPKLKGKGKDNRPIRGVAFIREAEAPGGGLRSPVDMSYDLELSNTGKPLAPGERGANILRLRSMGETDETIARRLGIGTRWVADLAKLGRSDPRLKALVKAGVIPPTTAILLTRAHGETKGVEIATAAAGMAKAEGKAVATGKTIAKAEAAAGVEAKVGGKNKAAKGRDKTAGEAVKVTVAPAVVAPSRTAGKTVALLAGPFTLGRDLEERTVYDANGLALCEMPDVGMARAVLQCLMLGWGVLKGTASPAASPAKGKASKAAAAAVPPVTVPAPVAPISAAEREAAKAEREARVTRQVLAADAPRVAKAEAVKAAAAALGKGKPLAALVAANAGKVAAATKAAAAKAKAEADAAVAKAEADEAEAIRLAAIEAAGLASPAKGKGSTAAKAGRALASVKAVVAASKAAKGKANGAAKASRK